MTCLPTLNYGQDGRPSVRVILGDRLLPVPVRRSGLRHVESLGRESSVCHDGYPGLLHVKIVTTIRTRSLGSILVNIGG